MRDGREAHFSSLLGGAGCVGVAAAVCIITFTFTDPDPDTVALQGWKYRLG